MNRAEVFGHHRTRQIASGEIVRCRDNDGAVRRASVWLELNSTPAHQRAMSGDVHAVVQPDTSSRRQNAKGVDPDMITQVQSLGINDHNRRMNGNVIAVTDHA